MGEVSCNYRMIGSDIDGLKPDEKLGWSVFSFNGDRLTVGGTRMFLYHYNAFDDKWNLLKD